MGNWKQVQARIRKARTGADAPAKLEQLFLKTHDAMVAFELAKLHEQGQRADQALDWYRKAYEHFRRDEWRVKASEAIQRLGGTPPAPVADSESGPAGEPVAAAPPAKVVPTPLGWASLPDRLFHESEKPPRSESDEEPSAAAGEETAGEIVEEESAQPGNVSPVAGAPPSRPGAPRPDGKSRRRGRRGGRRHRRGASGVETQGRADAPQLGQVIERPPERASGEPTPSRPPAPPRAEATEESGWVGPRAEEMRTRTGDPGLASRVARMEMQIRRLLACPPHKVSEGDSAPAGPGVLILSDSDLTTHYFITACDTLRIEIGRMTRSDRGGRSRGREERPALRSRLAEHLEISESQAVKYLESHCVVRWLQLDEGASKVAHFAIAALEPILNE